MKILTPVDQKANDLVNKKPLTILWTIFYIGLAGLIAYVVIGTAIENLPKEFEWMLLFAVPFGMSLVFILSIKKITKNNVAMNLINAYEFFDAYIEVSTLREDVVLGDNFKKFAEFKITYQLIGNHNFKKRFKGDNIDLDNFPFSHLMLPSRANSSRTTIDAFFASKNITLNPKYELDNYVLLYEFVKAGFGVAFVSKEYYKAQIAKKEVEVIYPEFNITARTLVGLTDKNQTNPAAAKFIEIASSKQK